MRQLPAGGPAPERETLEAVTAARANVGSAGTATPPTDPAQLQQFEAAQSQLSSALGRLMVASRVAVGGW